MKHTKKVCLAGVILGIISTQFSGQLHTSEEGLKFIMHYEECRKDPYQCQAGKWTNGIGNTHNVDPTKDLTDEQVAYDFVMNVKDAEKWAMKGFDAVKHSPTQAQFDASVSFIINKGQAPWLRSPMRYGDCTHYMDYVYYTDPKTKQKKKSNGLVNRASGEQHLCLTGKAS